MHGILGVFRCFWVFLRYVGFWLILGCFSGILDLSGLLSCVIETFSVILCFKLGNWGNLGIFG